MLLKRVFMAYGLACGCFDGFRVYSLHNVCVPLCLFVHMTCGSPNVDVAAGCFLSPLHELKIDIAIYTRAHS